MDMINVRIKADALPERNYTKFVFEGKLFTVTRKFSKHPKDVVEAMLKQEPHNYESDDVVAEPKKQESVIEESGDITPSKTSKRTKKNINNGGTHNFYRI